MKQLAANIAAVALSGLVAACTVQPLYAPSTPSGSVAEVSGLQSIFVKPVDERVAQQVRNELIFLLNGGAGQPANPEYELELVVTEDTKKVLIVLTNIDGEPTSSSVKITVNYRLVRAEDGELVANRRAFATASYDLTNQEYANIRAQRDAENRAARDVAASLRALIASDLKKAGKL